jgi:chromosome segregation protein
MSAQDKKNEASADLGSLKEEQTEIDEQFNEITAGKEQTAKDLEASQEEEKDVNKRVSQYQVKLDELRACEASQSSDVSVKDLEYEKMLQKQGFEQTNIDRIDGEIERFKEELDEVTLNLEKCLIEIEEKEKNIESIEATIKESANYQSEAEIALKEKQQVKEELSTKQKNFFARREEISEKKNSLDKEVYRLTSQIERLENSIEDQINYMWNEYEITLGSAAAMRNEELNDIGKMKADIASIKDEIKKLGDVNVNAIEDYRVLMERYTFMKTQHDDLVEAQKTLEGIIEELDTAMRKQFAEKFEEIKREFDKVFKELFGGGKGTLELIEGEDILEAGIRIIAQPPGKKLQNMMQLSGGEKSFTAIALLFAIQNLKPSPFCLLDEIEAALDEGNVSRFAKYLNKLTKSTQFIVITHRRGTMEQADRLYGITMQEKGVSTLVSVNLVDNEVEKWSSEEVKDK